MVIGPNGSGKTTLLQMLNGIFWPDKGKITIKGKVGALIAIGAGFHPFQIEAVDEKISRGTGEFGKRIRTVKKLDGVGGTI